MGEKSMVKIEEVSQQIATLVEGAEFLSVSTRSEYDCLVKMEDTAAGFVKQVHEYWDGLVEKAHSAHKDVCGKRKAQLDPLESFIKVCRRVSGAYLAQEQQKAQEQASLLMAQAAKAGIDTSMVPQAPAKADPGSGRTLVQTWTFSVEDEAKIPREYFVLDTSKVQKVVTALKDKTSVPGIRVFQENSIRRTGR